MHDFYHLKEKNNENITHTYMYFCSSLNISLYMFVHVYIYINVYVYINVYCQTNVAVQKIERISAADNLQKVLSS